MQKPTAYFLYFAVIKVWGCVAKCRAGAARNEKRLAKVKR